ncbi:hypothetical protein Bca4012_085313 [Brassica carinata]|uniref:Uncharacterized protein n=1 Tax=Brassica carinata TaxID=52824 RepID=A0A8X7SGC0_BRACI|nr:hypothetical protein Bca52824_025491 [Brassica carinata]
MSEEQCKTGSLISSSSSQTVLSPSDNSLPEFSKHVQKQKNLCLSHHHLQRTLLLKPNSA